MMSTLRIAMLMILWVSACAGTVDPSDEDSAPNSPTPTDKGGGGAADASPPVVEETKKPVASPKESNAVCTVGQVMPCSCPGGMPGTRTCLSSDGQQSACGCLSPSGPDVLIPPPEPKRYSCGGKVCPLYTEEETSVSARGCCTADGSCGSSSEFVFGTACLPRGIDAGEPSPSCPDETPNFLDLYGCCRPDGACGLSIDQVANFDVGCIERTEMAKLLIAGGGQRDFLSLIFFLPNPKPEYKAIRCK